MATEAEIAAQKAEQDKKDAEAAKLKADADAKAKAEADAQKNNTVGKLFNKGERKDKDGKVVPEAVFLEQKKALKEAQEEIQRLKDSGASKGEIKKSLKDIADKYDVDPDFVNDIASAVKSDSDKEVDEKIASKLKPIEDKERREQANKAFNSEYERSITALGDEYKKIANKATIQALAEAAANDPDKKDLTIEQILRETYGHLVKGTKKSVEGVRPKDGAGQITIDYDRAKTDKTYYEEIMSDPATKAEYNKDLHKRLKL